MAKLVCDTCSSTSDVEECMVSYRFGTAAPWAVDLCDDCYRKHFGALFKRSHPVRRTLLKPQIRVKRTEVTPEQLGEA